MIQAGFWVDMICEKKSWRLWILSLGGAISGLKYDLYDSGKHIFSQKIFEEKPKYSETDVAPIYSILSSFHIFISKWVLYFLSQLKHNEMRCQGTPEKWCFYIVSNQLFPCKRMRVSCACFTKGPPLPRKSEHGRRDRKSWQNVVCFT